MSSTTDPQPGSSVRAAVARNAASSYLSRGLLLVSALVLTPYLYRRLGAPAFGTWSVVFTLTTIFSLLEIGFSDGIVRFVADRRAHGRTDELRRLVPGAVSLMMFLGGVAAATAVAAAFLLEGLAAAAERDDFRGGMLVLGAAMLVRFPLATAAAVLLGHQRYDLGNAATILTTVVFAAGAVAAVESGHGVLGLAVAQAGALVGGGALAAVFLRRIAPELPLRPGRGGRAILGFSSLTLLAESFNFVGQRLDVVVIAAVRGAATAAPYAAALKLQSGVQSLTLPFVDLLMPMASELWAQGRRDELMRRVTFATRVAWQLTLPLAVALAIFAEDVVRLWLGTTAAATATATAIVVVLMAVQLVALPAAPARRVLVGIGRVRAVAVLSVVEGVASLVLTIALVSAYGAVGAALATLIAVSVVAPLKYPLLCRALGRPLLPFLRGSLGTAVATTAPALAAMAAIRLLLDEGATRALAGLAAGGLLAGVAVAATLGFAGGPRWVHRRVRDSTPRTTPP